MVLHVPFLVPNGYRSITLFPFIFIRSASDAADRVLLNHERIHLRQQAELLVLPFYIWYAVEFLIRYAEYRNGHAAYRNISFEREAYAHESDSGYGSRRRAWAFAAYLHG
jgi:hypothetical protein